MDLDIIGPRDSQNDRNTSFPAYIEYIVLWIKIINPVIFAAMKLYELDRTQREASEICTPPHPHPHPLSSALAMELRISCTNPSKYDLRVGPF